MYKNQCTNGGKRMKAVVIKEPGNISLQNVEIPEPGENFVRIKVKAGAICATDLEVLDGNIPANYPHQGMNGAEL